MPRKKGLLYPCITCGNSCTAKPSSIECAECCRWVHRRCVPMGPDTMELWKEEGLAFLCRDCAFDGDQYDVPAALTRIKRNSIEMRPIAAKAEQLMLETYAVHVPPTSHTQIQQPTDCIAADILKMLHPGMLTSHRPVGVVGDGNCMFRCLSLGLFGTQAHHTLIRLKTAIEVILNKEYYDITHPNFLNCCNDSRLLFQPYNQFQDTVLTDGCYSCLLTVAAASAALGTNIQSYCPPTVNSYFLAEPLSRLVTGRGVKLCPPSLVLMWSMMVVPADQRQYEPNHFVILLEKDKSESFVDLTDDYEDEVGEGADNDEDEVDEGDDDKDEVDDGDDKVDEGNNDDDEDGVGDGDDKVDEGNNDDDEDGVDEGEEDDDDEDDDEDDDDVVNNVSDNDDHDGKDDVAAAGGKPLPHGKFLESHVVIKLLNSRSKPSLQEVPRGEKDNVFFVVDNQENLDRRSTRKKSQFWDDRGAWVGGSSSKTFFVEQSGTLRSVTYHHNQYCVQQRSEGRYVQVPLNPQPKDVITLHRYYAKHSSGAKYEKRVSFLTTENTPVAVHEFKGCCPMLTPHSYIRSKPSLIAKLKEDVKSKTPGQIYQTVEEKDLLEGPSNKRQICNIKARTKTADGQALPKANFADQVSALEELQQTMPFLQLILRQSKKVPCVILYTEDQIADLKRFCCPPLTAQSTVLGVDKTFNLSDVHVTVTVYKHLGVVRRNTKEYPIFCGPLLLHGNSDRDTFFTFFHHLSGKLIDCPQTPILGSDEEMALRQAMALAFPKSQRLACTRHLRKNFMHSLVDKVGLPRKERQNIVSKLFGENGIIAKSADHHDVADRMQHMVESTQNETVKRLIHRLSTLFVENSKALERAGLHVESPLWTNNNCESMNHCLKQAVSWRSLKLVELVHKLHNIITSQYREIHRAICGVGEFVLVEEYKKFAVPRDVWYSYSEKQRKRHLKKFSGTLKESLVRSTNMKKIAIQPKHKGKKPSQKKRKLSEKTSSAKKKARTVSQTSEDDFGA